MTIRTASKTAFGALMLAAFLVPAFAGVAKADDRRGDRGWHEHEARAYRWHRVHPVAVPGYVYAPPPAVYYPPEPSPGINLILPLHFN